MQQNFEFWIKHICKDKNGDFLKFTIYLFSERLNWSISELLQQKYLIV